MPAPRAWSETARLRALAAAVAGSNLFWLAVTAALLLVTYGPSLSDWFVTDDFIFLRATRFAGALAYMKDAFDFSGYDRHQEFIDFLRDENIALPFLSYRPLYFISLKWMNLAFGDSPEGYHAVSLAVHGANTFLVWLIAFRLMGSRLASHVAALVFALHPAYVAAVAWISDIATPLAIFAVLLALLMFMKSQDGESTKRNWYAGSLVIYGASTLVHQETISWVVAFAAFYFLIKLDHPRRALDPARWSLLLPFVGLAAGSYLLQSWVTANTAGEMATFHLGRHMLTHFKNFASGSLFPVTSGAAAAHFLAFIAFLLVLVTLPVVAFVSRAGRALPRLELFIGLWFVAALVPLLTLDSPVFFGVGVLNRKLYAVGPALALLLVAYGRALLDLAPGGLRTQARVAAAVVLVALLAGAMTVAADRRGELSDRAEESERFVQTLRETYPVIPEGSSLYVVNAPRALAGFAFGDIYLVTSVQAFYGRVQAYSVTEQQAAAVERRGERDEYVFRYRPAPP